MRAFGYGLPPLREGSDVGGIVVFLDMLARAGNGDGMPLNEMDERLQILEQWVSQDVRSGREDEKWLNILLQKQDRKQNTT